MNCLPCFRSEGKGTTDRAISTKAPSPVDIPKDTSPSSNSQTFTFRELAMATKNFRQECLLGEGGFGRVFKGKLHSTGQVVAVKQLDRNGMQGSKEFLVEVLMLSLLHHPNLVNLIGYCADGDQRLLVYEFMPMGSLEHHLFGDGPDKKPLDWVARMKIAAGAAKGLEYLHEKANPRVIYRDLKPSNILLDENFDTKLSDFGLAKLSPTGGKAQPASRVMGTYGYSAPEYSSNGELTLKSDVYNFGVVLLELITGRRVIDTTRPTEEQNLVTWAQPIFRDPKRFPDMADSRLNKHFPVTSLNQAVGIAAMCLQEDPSVRPLIGDVVAALSFISEVPNESIPPSVPRGDVPSKEHPIAFTPPPEQKMEYGNEVPQNCPTQPEKDYSDHSDISSSDSEDGDGDRRSVDQHSEASCHTSDRHITNSDSSKHSDGESDGHSDGSNNSDGESIYHSDGPEVDDMDHNDAHLRQGSSMETKQGDVTLKQCSANTLSAYRLDMSSENGSGRKTGRGDVSSDHGSGCTLSDGFTSSSGHDMSRKSPANELGSSSKRCSRKKLEELDASSKHCSSKKHEELGSSSKCRRSKKLEVHDSSSKCCSNKKLEDLGSSSKRSSSKKLGAGAGTGSGKRSTSRHKSSKHRTVVTFKEPSMNSRYNRAEKSVNADPAAEPGLAPSGASSGLLQDENHKPASEVLENGSIKAVDVREAQPNAISREDGSSSSDSSDDEEKALNDLHNHRVFDNNKPSINPKLRHLRTR